MVRLFSVLGILFIAMISKIKVPKLSKTEMSRHLGPWEEIGRVEGETLCWVYWYNNHRLMGSKSFWQIRGGSVMTGPFSVMASLSQIGNG
ncbi:hypothetical protein TH606_11110 [Thermodesulfatator autotrophicus]|uniref:Uncharacterized protein n=1 Tax=Thermodesulfatator autotrophicus TaxID=1795632 RepID=A0A177E599_9BACT|nr:hypothetical protein TH606_11110 [Thermodesulfatator autotrophicus]